MLPKKFRITYSDFQKNPNQIVKHFGSFIDIFSKQNDKGVNRFVFIVPKYIDKRSVYRHRIKRLMTEVIREIIPDLKTSLDFLVKLKKRIEKNGRKQIEKDILFLLNKVKPA